VEELNHANNAVQNRCISYKTIEIFVCDAYYVMIPSQFRNIKNNRFLHTFLGKTGWSSTSDINFMSFREWSAAKRAKRNKNLYHEWKITRAFPTTHVSTYFFLSRTSRDPRHWSVTNLHKLSDQYHKIERYEIHIT
jgi:hypothetical protein